MKKRLILPALMAVSIMASAQQNPVNGNFEDTLLVPNQSGFDTLPRNWSTSAFGAGATADAASGKHAAYIWNWYYYAKGVLTNGKSTQPGKGGYPINFKPSGLNGFYKYLPGNAGTTNDSAVVYIVLTKHNASTHLRDTVGSGTKKFPAQSSYKAFQVPINYLSSAQPDTVSITFYSSLSGFCSNSSSGNCLFFYVDDLTLTNPATGIQSHVELNAPEVYPNPADDLVYIENTETGPVQVNLYASDGHLLRSSKIESNTKETVNLSALPRGVYFIRYSGTEKTIRILKN